MASPSYRPMYKFWLNWKKPEEKAIADTIVGLKENNLFSKTIRDGIRLICDLRAGRLDVLFELFPWVQAEFLKYMEEVQPAEPQTQSGALSGEVEKYLQEILEKLNQPQLTTGLQPVSAGAGGPQTLQVPQFAKPSFDDEDEEDDLLVIGEDTRQINVADNFIQSLKSLM